MNDEYKMLRSEMEDKIREQDTLYNIVFTILGISSVFSTFFGNIIFLFLVSFLSFVLLVRIEGNRVYVYAILTYLRELEKRNSGISNVSWERRLNIFRRKMFKLKDSSASIPVRLTARYGPFIKHASNIALVTFIFCQEIVLIFGSNAVIEGKIILYIISSFLLFLNLFATISICTDKRLNKIYSERWEEQFNNENHE